MEYIRRICCWKTGAAKVAKVDKMEWVLLSVCVSCRTRNVIDTEGMKQHLHEEE